MKKRILALLPESIGGRLTMTSLFKGFERCGFELTLLDVLGDAANKIKEIKLEEYDFLVSYDFVGIKFKIDYNLNIKTINYFSDVIESDCSGKYWMDYHGELAKPDNYIFYWDEKLTKEAKNIANIVYLPHAVDIDTYRNLDLPSEYDVMFAGRLTYGIRLDRFLNLVKALPEVKFALYCFPKHLEQVCEKISEEDKYLLKSIYKGFIDTEEKMTKAINKSKIVINYTSQGESSLNYRLFQVLACERFLLTDYRSELESLFKIGKDIVYYENDNDLVIKIQDYMKNPEKYIEIIKKGRKTVEEKYSSTQAVKKILQAPGVAD